MMVCQDITPNKLSNTMSGSFPQCSNLQRDDTFDSISPATALLRIGVTIVLISPIFVEKSVGTLRREVPRADVQRTHFISNHMPRARRKAPIRTLDVLHQH